MSSTRVQIEFLALILALPALLFSQSPTPERPKKFGHSLIEFEKRSTPPPQKGTQPDNGEVLRVETNLVITDVLVVDKTGRVVTGLQKSDFFVSEDEKPQRIELFSFGRDERVPRSIVLIMEAGMHLSAPFKRNIEAARKLIDRLGPGDRMAIATDNLELLSGFTEDKKTLTSVLDRLKDRQRSSKHDYSTLLAILREIFNGEEKLPIIILQSSGDEFLGLKPIWPRYLAACRSGYKAVCERSFSFGDVLDVVERSRATIYGIVPTPKVVGLGPDEQKRQVAEIIDSWSEGRDRSEMLKFRNKMSGLVVKEVLASHQSVIDVTRLSGGFTTFLESADKVEELYSSIFATIENRYAIGYYSDSEDKTKKRSVKIAVKGHPEYSVVARKSFVPTPAK